MSHHNFIAVDSPFCPTQIKVQYVTFINSVFFFINVFTYLLKLCPDNIIWKKQSEKNFNFSGFGHKMLFYRLHNMLLVLMN